MATVDLRRRRSPMGGYGELLLLAACVAGRMNEFAVLLNVTRMAWLTAPACTSASFTRPARIDNPAASALVQPSGRSALELSGNTAPFAHWNGAPPPETQFQASYATQLDALDPCCSTRPC